MRASKFMEAHGIEVKEMTPASRKLGEEEASTLFKAASKVIVAKGKKVSQWKTGGKADADGIAAMLGPTGNLRAPTVRVGKTVVVGFNDEVYELVFG